MNELLKVGSADHVSEEIPVAAYGESITDVIKRLNSSAQGLSQQEASARLDQYGRNVLPAAELPGKLAIFLRQFMSPLIYVLVAAAVVSVFIQEWSDAIFIVLVLLLNAMIGTVQEVSAQHSAEALQKLVTTSVKVMREGDTYEINSEQLIPGDIVLLESGDRVPADLRLITSHDFELDESLLTGESEPSLKDAGAILVENTVMGDRINMSFAGTLVNHGRGRGMVVATALNTELGRIAESVLGKPSVKPPLLVRMEKFTSMVTIIVGIVILIMAVVALLSGMPLSEIFLISVALAVTVIPEGLPVALTVALAIGMRRMAKRNVIVRRLIAVEALGSCTFIATDKTGTLTVNQLTVRKIAFPCQETWDVDGASQQPEGSIVTPSGTNTFEENTLLARFCQAAVLANEGFLAHHDHGWSHHGDAVDVALLVMSHKNSVVKEKADLEFPALASIPFESEQLFCASLNQVGNKQIAFVKGALEKLLPMCSMMATLEKDIPIDATLLEQQAEDLTNKAYRVIALVAGSAQVNSSSTFSERDLHDLTFLGLVGIIDPLRSGAKEAVKSCRAAGIKVAMVTGDHPSTAFAIAQELELAESPEQVVTGSEIKQAENQAGSQTRVDQLIKHASVFARVEPHQKLDIVHSLQRNGHFVAVSGDGANDAPALRAAQVGVAMGKSGTDVARETAEIIITDDNFDSIVAGVEEGRIAYANVRKVISLLIATGAGELVLFTLSLITGLPLPLLAVQLLWLNLVTNGIQDVALAFEPGEGDELRRPPRAPKESIFDRLMIERVVISALTMGIVSFFLFQSLLTAGYDIDTARNSTLLLMVLFENVHVLNCRSEIRSAFRHNLLRNPFLLFGTAAAQLIHIGAMYMPWLSDVLRIQPVSFQQWLELLGLAFIILLVIEMHKFIKSKLVLQVNDLIN